MDFWEQFVTCREHISLVTKMDPENAHFVALKTMTWCIVYAKTIPVELSYMKIVADLTEPLKQDVKETTDFFDQIKVCSCC
jgi:hypothetical protein